jgi:sugar phosphate isomerase/epimerase
VPGIAQPILRGDAAGLANTATIDWRKENPMQIQCGCLTRPWHEFTLEQALAGISGAGYKTVGFTGPVVSADMTDGDVKSLRALLQANGLEPQVSISQPRMDLDPDEAVYRFQREMARAKEVGLTYFILCGTNHEDKYEQWYSTVQRCLDYAGEHGLMLLLKPHGGISALGADLLRAADRINHPSFGICYDPGNIYYYTGQSAEEDLPPVAPAVRAMCIKDETGGKHGEVALTPGTGLVDFKRVFSTLNDAGFSGPCWVECLGGKTIEELNREAKRTYDFITDVVASV